VPEQKKVKNFTRKFAREWIESYFPCIILKGRFWQVTAEQFHYMDGFCEALGIMKNLFILIVLAVTFVFGYHFGRQPNSPDLVGWLSVKSQEACVVGRDVAAAIGEKYEEMVAESDSSY